MPHSYTAITLPNAMGGGWAWVLWLAAQPRYSFVLLSFKTRKGRGLALADGIFQGLGVSPVRGGTLGNIKKG